MRLVWGVVTAVELDSADVQVVEVELDDGTAGVAFSFPRLSGACRIADSVLVNTTAVDLDLGTGGRHFVVARSAGDEGVALDEPSGGHIMKLRYTPHQVDVMCVEEQGSPDHEAMRTAVSLSGMPVVCCGLHSQVPLVAAAAKNVLPEARIAYVMTDFAALPLPLSDLLRASRSVGLVDATVSAGQAFGGEYEAVNTHSALLAARHVARSDIAIVAIGPGVVGTATPFGHGGIAQGEAINAAAALDGTPVAVLRASFADTRARHRGVSHHTLTALSRIALARAVVAVPSLPDEYAEAVEDALERAGIWDRHERADSTAGRDAPPSTRGVDVKTMGRGFEQDPAFFAAAFAAGDVAARYARGDVGLPKLTALS